MQRDLEWETNSVGLGCRREGDCIGSRCHSLRLRDTLNLWVGQLRQRGLLGRLVRFASSRSPHRSRILSTDRYAVGPCNLSLRRRRCVVAVAAFTTTCQFSVRDQGLCRNLSGAYRVVMRSAKRNDVALDNPRSWLLPRRC